MELERSVVSLSVFCMHIIAFFDPVRNATAAVRRPWTTTYLGFCRGDNLLMSFHWNGQFAKLEPRTLIKPKITTLILWGSQLLLSSKTASWFLSDFQTMLIVENS
jgi:hypothetical protein